MRYRLRRWQLVTALIVVCAAAAAAFYLWRMRGASPEQMAAFLPTGDSLLLYLDIDAMRHSGLLDAIAGPKSEEDSDYRQFIDQSGFDYRDDLKALAVAIRQNPATHERDEYAVARGNFDWKRLEAYAQNHGGQCSGGFCRIPASQPHRFISFYPLRTHLMAIAVSGDQWAALLITHGPGPRGGSDLPTQPVWMLAPAAALESQDLFPEGTRAYASALKGAERVALTLGAQGDHLALSLDVKCSTVDQASALNAHLEQLTDTLRKWIAREHLRANPGDLSGVLTSGSFRREDRRVYGVWPLPKEFIHALTDGGGSQ